MLQQTISVDDAIVAIASPPAPATRGVVRLSGANVAQILAGVCGPEFRSVSMSDLFPRRHPCQISLPSPLGPVPVDLMRWPTERSYTGQPSAEIHTFGSLPILRAIVEVCCGQGARSAKPGEFTMRAFLAGRLDLTQAEAVLGVIEAELPETLNGALQQLAGNLSRPLGKIRGELLDLLADVEAGLDFVDEDLEFIADDTLIKQLVDIQTQVINTSAQMVQRENAEVTTRVVFQGQPNAGKSRLLNAICGRQAAIVSDIAGTTRDVVTASIDIEGHRLLLQDTAGHETSDETIMRQAQSKAAQAIAGAQVRLWCLDASRDDFLNAQHILETQAAATSKSGCVDLLVATKVDLVPSENDAKTRWIRCSSETGAGIGDLKKRMVEAVQQATHQESSGVIGTAARCHQSLAQAAAALQSAIKHTRCQAGHEFVSADLRSAASAIGEVTGEVYNEDILDRVFSRFCIGK